MSKATMTAAEIGEAVGIDRTTVHRYLRTLVEIGIVHQDEETRRYRLGLQVLRFGHVVLDTLDVRRVALSHFYALRWAVDTQLILSVPDGLDVVQVDRIWDPTSPSAQRLSQLDIGSIGSRFPLHQGVSGRVMLASLRSDALERTILGLEARERDAGREIDEPLLRLQIDQIRENRYALADQEVSGLYAIAVPLLGTNGEARASITVSATSDEDLELFCRRWAPVLLRTAGRISTALGYSG